MALFLLSAYSLCLPQAQPQSNPLDPLKRANWPFTHFSIPMT